jgi:hypothetical protein
MIINAIEMQIDDVFVPAPKIGGMIRKLEKVWSKNTGRTASAKMQGTIKAVKYTYSIEWPPLTQDQQELIEGLVSDITKPFRTLRIRRPDGFVQEFECYFGTPTFSEWEMIGGTWRCTNAKVDAIER